METEQEVLEKEETRLTNAAEKLELFLSCTQSDPREYLLRNSLGHLIYSSHDLNQIDKVLYEATMKSGDKMATDSYDEGEDVKRLEEVAKKLGLSLVMPLIPGDYVIADNNGQIQFSSSSLGKIDGYLFARGRDTEKEGIEGYKQIESIEEFITLLENKEAIYFEAEIIELETCYYETYILSWKIVKEALSFIRDKKLYKKEYQYQIGFYSIMRVKGYPSIIAEYTGNNVWYITGSEKKFRTGDFHEIYDKINLH